MKRTTVYLSGCLSGAVSFVLTSCLSRVYHIDSNPSGASDSGTDFAKAFTVSHFHLSSFDDFLTSRPEVSKFFSKRARFENVKMSKGQQSALMLF